MQAVLASTIRRPSGSAISMFFERDRRRGPPLPWRVRAPPVPSALARSIAPANEGQPVDHRFEVGEGVVIVDEEGEGAFNPRQNAPAVCVMVPSWIVPAK